MQSKTCQQTEVSSEENTKISDWKPNSIRNCLKKTGCLAYIKHWEDITIAAFRDLKAII